MTLTVLRRSIAAVALFSALALVAACSGTPSSSLLSPTGPSGILAASAGSSAFNPSTGGDPCAPTIAAEGFTTNPGDPPPPPPPPPPPCLDGRFTGGFLFNSGDLKVTGGFTLHCDAILSNNFEVNWEGGNNFHIDKNPTDVVCTLLNDPNPPDAPVSRIRISGPGTLNGQPATVVLVLIDNGEKAGAPPDQAYIAVNGQNLTGGSEAAPPAIDGGNIQAHFDQPHKN